MHARHAALGHVAHGGIEGAVVGRLPRRRDDREHEFHGAVAQEARGLAVGAALDRAAGRIGRVTVDAGERERAPIGERHVPVVPAHQHGVRRRVRVDPPPLGERAAPRVMIPVPAGDPLARREPARELAHAPRQLPGRGRMAQLHRGETRPAREEVHVRVHEPRHEHRAARVDHALGAALAQCGAGPHAFDPIAAHGDRVGPRTTRVGRPDARVHDRERGHRGPPAPDEGTMT